VKGKRVTIVLIIIFIVGLFLLLYPTISNYINSKVQTKAIMDYNDMYTKIDEKEYENLFSEAYGYNQELYSLKFPLTQYKKISNYDKVMNIDGHGMIGYISINKINVMLPVYHGTAPKTLNRFVGHMEGTSLPVGGENTHSVLSAHRGLPSAKLFTDLNKLELGDTFTITILNKKLTYQIDKILIIEPNDPSNLGINKNEDRVTLLTCTPYGLNTHRLLVSAVRIENSKEIIVNVSEEAQQIDKLIVSFYFAVPILLILILYIMFKPIKQKVPKRLEDL